MNASKLSHKRWLDWIDVAPFFSIALHHCCSFLGAFLSFSLVALQHNHYGYYLDTRAKTILRHVGQSWSILLILDCSIPRNYEYQLVSSPSSSANTTGYCPCSGSWPASLPNTPGVICYLLLPRASFHIPLSPSHPSVSCHNYNILSKPYRRERGFTSEHPIVWLKCPYFSSGSSCWSFLTSSHLTSWAYPTGCCVIHKNPGWAAVP